MPIDYNEIAGIKNGRDWTRGWVTNFQEWLPTTDRLLELKSGGDLKIYEQVAQDDQVKSCLQQRFRALISHDWEVIPAGEKRQDRQVAEFVTSQLKNLRWDDTVEKMLWGIFYGYSIAEVIWEKQADKIGIKAIKVRNQRRFHFDEDFKPRLRTFATPFGEELPDQKFWHFSCGHHHDDEPYGRGLAHWLYWMVFFKKNDIRWWIRFLELYAQPARKGKYPAAATTQEKDVLWGALAAFGVDGRMMIPEGLDIELVEASRSGTADYEALLKQINESIAKIILSQTMTTDSGSSLSQAEVHQDVGESVIMADADLICASFNTSVVKWLCDFNFPGIDVYPKFAYKLDSAPDLKALADRDKVLSDMGFPPTEEYIVATYGEGFQQDPALAKNSRLNSGQITALTGLLSQATQSAWTAETLETALSIAFPQVRPDQAIKLAKSLTAQPATVPSQAPSADAPLEDLSTLFGLTEGAIKNFKGRDYRLTNSRWRRVDDGADLETGARIPDEKLTRDAIKKSQDSEHLNHLAKKLDGSASALQSHMDSGVGSFDRDIETLQELADVARGKRDRIDERDLDKQIEEGMEAAPHKFSVSRSAGVVSIKRAGGVDNYGTITQTSSPLTVDIKPNQTGGHEVRVSGYESSFTDSNGQAIPDSQSKMSASVHQIDGIAIDKITEKSKQMAVEAWLTKNVFDKLKTTAYFQAIEHTDPVLELVSTMQGQDHFKPWLQQLQGLLNNSGDLAEFQAALESAFPDLDSADFRAAMIEATTVASLGGYSDSTNSQKG
jgi:phage gp29-like protein